MLSILYGFLCEWMNRVILSYYFYEAPTGTKPTQDEKYSNL